MRRKGLLPVVVMNLTLLTQLPVGAEDRAAESRVRRWGQALQTAKQLSLRFQIRRIDHTFKREFVGIGRYYRNETGSWRFSIRPPIMEPLSALQPANGPNPGLETMLPETKISTPDVLYHGVGDPPQYEGFRWLPASALTVENVTPPLQLFRKSTQAELIQRYILQHEALLFFPLDSRIVHLDAELLPKSDEYDRLRFVVRKQVAVYSPFCQVDAIFDRNSDLPRAIRLVDIMGHNEYRMEFRSIGINRTAEIPADAFDPPSELIAPLDDLVIAIEPVPEARNPRTTNH